MYFSNVCSWLDRNPFHFFLNRKTVSTDLTKPLIIPAGSDSFSQIGNLSHILLTRCHQQHSVVQDSRLQPSALTLGSPCATDVDITSLHAKNPKDLWRKVCGCVFPPEVGRWRLIMLIFVAHLWACLDVFYVERTPAGPEGPRQRSAVQRASDRCHESSERPGKLHWHTCPIIHQQPLIVDTLFLWSGHATVGSIRSNQTTKFVGCWFWPWTLIFLWGGIQMKLRIEKKF